MVAMKQEEKIELDEGFATFDELFNKPPRTDDVELKTPGGIMKLRLQAIGSVEYDEMIAKHQPTRDQRERGMGYNPDTFTPALIARCSLKPKLTMDQTTKLYNNPNWAGGELGAVFIACQRLCNAGLDVPFNEGV